MNIRAIRRALRVHLTLHKLGTTSSFNDAHVQLEQSRHVCTPLDDGKVKVTYSVGTSEREQAVDACFDEWRADVGEEWDWSCERQDFLDAGGRQVVEEILAAHARSELDEAMHMLEIRGYTVRATLTGPEPHLLIVGGALAMWPG